MRCATNRAVCPSKGANTLGACRHGGVMNWLLSIAFALMPVGAMAPTALPPGTLIPVSLSGSLNVSKLHAGHAFRGEVMQSLPGTSIKRGAQVEGTVVNFDKGNHPRLEIRFESVVSH